MSQHPSWPQHPAGGAPTGPSAHGGSFVRLHLQGSALTGSMIAPTVTINGYRVPANYGENLIPVHPGPTLVEAKASWLREYGQAGYEVNVAPGQVVDLWYAQPWTQFQTGSMGPTKQQRKGGLVMAGVLGAIVLVIVVLPVLGVFAG